MSRINQSRIFGCWNQLPRAARASRRPLSVYHIFAYVHFISLRNCRSGNDQLHSCKHRSRSPIQLSYIVVPISKINAWTVNSPSLVPSPAYSNPCRRQHHQTDDCSRPLYATSKRPIRLNYQSYCTSWSLPLQGSFDIRSSTCRCRPSTVFRPRRHPDREEK
jgi:hypothetical protein